MRLYDFAEPREEGVRPQRQRSRDHVLAGPPSTALCTLAMPARTWSSMVAKRYLSRLGYRVTLVENITDIDDKIIRRAEVEGRSAAEVGAEFAQAYRDDAIVWAWGGRM